MDKQITVYGADWCGDTVRAKRYLDGKGVTYTFVDIEEDEAAEKKVIEFNKGKRRIPLIEISGESGTTSLSVPSATELDTAIGA